MISTPAEALHPNVQIHLVLGVGGVGGRHDKHTRRSSIPNGGGWGAGGGGMISTPVEALSPNVRCVGARTRCEHEQPKALRAVRGPVGRWARGRMGADSCPSVQERSARRCLGAARGTWLHFQRSEAISTFSGVPKRFCFSVLKRWFCQRSGATHLPGCRSGKAQ